MEVTTLENSGDFWRMLARRPTAVPVVAACDARGPAGLLALSTTHIAASPPTMLVAVSNTTGALGTLLSAGTFAISYLPQGAQETAEIFGGRRQLSGADRFRPGDWTSLVTGAPVYRNAALALDCTIERTVEHEATTLLLGRIAAAVPGTAPALLFHQGRYGAMPGVDAS
ncbi:flavin reductase [Mesorhizobium sp. L-8-10]|uniref:flavin reductase family protein n=1 Tax=Mesorhizobium sp. L-8-10 TaxID=2744523 RepID=UPI0019285622|nr:flavin reductase family protein [Mesorhizobium sp. L-8-10]BCH29351.1 flavin reductase [Mesorhizobium sp. L-8-10]